MEKLKRIEEILDKYSLDHNGPLYPNMISFFEFKAIAKEISELDNWIDVPFDLEYELQNFRDVQSEYFDEDGNKYPNVVSDSIPEMMLKIINMFDELTKPKTK